jgi:hypothetical protein
MKTKLQLILTIILCILIIQTHAQKAEDIGAGVIDFLLSNPKTANKINSTEVAALDVIRDILKTKSFREHEIAVATAGSDQIILNEPSTGKQATIVKDQSNNIYLLYQGIIYPIEKSLIEQANIPERDSYENAIISKITLPGYNINILEDQYNKQNMGLELGKKLLYTSSRFDTYQEAEKKFGRSIDSKLYSNGFSKKQVKKMQKGEITLPDGIEYFEYFYNPKIICLFTYVWRKDLNSDGSFSLDEFNNIKRTFTINEDISICCCDYFDEDDTNSYSLKIDVIEQQTGNIIYTSSRTILSSNGNLQFFEIPEGQKRIGKYFINVVLKNNNTQSVVSQQKEELEIIN